jgi:hypothetical protein
MLHSLQNWFEGHLAFVWWVPVIIDHLGDSLLSSAEPSFLFLLRLLLTLFTDQPRIVVGPERGGGSLAL